MSRALRPVLVAALALAFASPAHAEVTVGQLVTPTACTGGHTYLQGAVASGTSYVIPSAGVITSWSVQNGASPITGLKLKVGRFVTGLSYMIVGESAGGGQTPNAVSTFPAQIPVRAGDILGEFENGGDCAGSTGNSADLVRSAAGDPAVGTTALFDGGFGDSRLSLQAKVEPDADGDGFGDETQDWCPGTSGTLHGCPSGSVAAGQLFAPDTGCPAETLLQTGVGSGNSYRIPSAGVITSWSWYDGADVVPTLELKVARLTGTADHYLIVGSSPAGTQTASTIGAWPTRIAVQAGDVIGVYVSGGDCLKSPTSSGDLVDFLPVDAPLGDSSDYDQAQSQKVPVRATVEPDADGDGYGDTTQDQCPTNASTQGPCPAKPPPAAGPPPPSTPPPSSGSTLPPDHSPPVVSASIHRLLRLSKKGTISFTLRSGEQATGRATGTISLPKASRVVRFRTAKVKLSANKRKRVTLRLSKRSLKSVRKALKHHRLKTKITVTLKDAAGNKTVKRLNTKLKR